jgi:hypothetical protein
MYVLYEQWRVTSRGRFDSCVFRVTHVCVCDCIHSISPFQGSKDEVHTRCIRGAYEVHTRCIRGAYEVHTRCIRVKQHAVARSHLWERILYTYTVDFDENSTCRPYTHLSCAHCLKLRIVVLPGTKPLHLCLCLRVRGKIMRACTFMWKYCLGYAALPFARVCTWRESSLAWACACVCLFIRTHKQPHTYVHSGTHLFHLWSQRYV